jgi:hypothetical protein
MSGRDAMERDRGLKLLVAILPLLTGWLYLLGIAHHQGYLSAYGAHHSLIPIGFEGALLTGLISLINWSFPALLYTAASVAAMVLSVSVVAAISIGRKPRIFMVKMIRRLKNRKVPSKGVPEVEKVLDGALSLNSAMLGVSLVFILLLATILLGLRSGESSAKKSMAEFTEDPSQGVQIDGVRSKVVVCSEQYCLIWDGSRTLQHKRDVLNGISMPSIGHNDRG